MFKRLKVLFKFLIWRLLQEPESCVAHVAVDGRAQQQ